MSISDLTPAVSLTERDTIPVHDAQALTQGCGQTHIVLNDKLYQLRITRAGKLILTK